MNPTELHTLFSAKEQTLLVATESARLTDLSEDELDELLTLVRRARNKRTDRITWRSANRPVGSATHGEGTAHVAVAPGLDQGQGCAYTGKARQPMIVGALTTHAHTDDA